MTDLRLWMWVIRAQPRGGFVVQRFEVRGAELFAAAAPRTAPTLPAARRILPHDLTHLRGYRFPENHDPAIREVWA